MNVRRKLSWKKYHNPFLIVVLCWHLDTDDDGDEFLWNFPIFILPHEAAAEMFMLRQPLRLKYCFLCHSRVWPYEFLTLRRMPRWWVTCRGITGRRSPSISLSLSWTIPVKANSPRLSIAFNLSFTFVLHSIVTGTACGAVDRCDEASTARQRWEKRRCRRSFHSGGSSQVQRGAVSCSESAAPCIQ